MALEEIGIIAGNWVDSAHVRDYWRALVNAALNLRVSKDMESVYFEVNLSTDLSIILNVLNRVY